MTYTIFECLKEKLNELLEDQTDTSVAAIITEVEKISVDAQVCFFLYTCLFTAPKMLKSLVCTTNGR